MAAEVISLGVWLDHIPLPVFSCCGWSSVVGLAGRKGGDGEREREKKGAERGREVGKQEWIWRKTGGGG